MEGLRRGLWHQVNNRGFLSSVLTALVFIITYVISIKSFENCQNNGVAGEELEEKFLVNWPPTLHDSLSHEFWVHADVNDLLAALNNYATCDYPLEMNGKQTDCVSLLFLCSRVVVVSLESWNSFKVSEREKTQMSSPVISSPFYVRAALQLKNIWSLNFGFAESQFQPRLKSTFYWILMAMRVKSTGVVCRGSHAGLRARSRYPSKWPSQLRWESRETY